MTLLQDADRFGLALSHAEPDAERLADVDADSVAGGDADAEEE
jgi:hypothetical protein